MAGLVTFTPALLGCCCLVATSYLPTEKLILLLLFPAPFPTYGNLHENCLLKIRTRWKCEWATDAKVGICAHFGLGAFTCGISGFGWLAAPLSLPSSLFDNLAPPSTFGAFQIERPQKKRDMNELRTSLVIFGLLSPTFLA